MFTSESLIINHLSRTVAIITITKFKKNYLKKHFRGVTLIFKISTTGYVSVTSSVTMNSDLIFFF